MPSARPVDISALSEAQMNAELEKGYADMQSGHTRSAKSCLLYTSLENGRQKQRLLIYGTKEKKLYCVLFQTICPVSERFLVKLHWKIFIYFIFPQSKE